MGVKTVAIYSTADAKAPFVKEADEAICVGPAAASQSYLDVSKVIKVIRDTGAEAVHPGYGKNHHYVQMFHGPQFVTFLPFTVPRFPK